MYKQGNALFEGREMRLIILLIAISLATPGSAIAAQKSNRGQCRRLAKQMSQHAVSMEAALEQGNRLWARSLDEQMGRMASRQNRLCPDLAPSRARMAARKAYEETKQFFAAAGKTALSYFTFGAY